MCPILPHRLLLQWYDSKFSTSVESKLPDFVDVVKSGTYVSTSSTNITAITTTGGNAFTVFAKVRCGMVRYGTEDHSMPSCRTLHVGCCRTYVPVGRRVVGSSCVPDLMCVGMYWACVCGSALCICLHVRYLISLCFAACL